MWSTIFTLVFLWSVFSFFALMLSEGAAWPVTIIAAIVAVLMYPSCRKSGEKERLKRESWPIAVHNAIMCLDRLINLANSMDESNTSRFSRGISISYVVLYQPSRYKVSTLSRISKLRGTKEEYDQIKKYSNEIQEYITNINENKTMAELMIFSSDSISSKEWKRNKIEEINYIRIAYKNFVETYNNAQKYLK